MGNCNGCCHATDDLDSNNMDKNEHSQTSSISRMNENHSVTSDALNIPHYRSPLDNNVLNPASLIPVSLESQQNPSVIDTPTLSADAPSNTGENSTVYRSPLDTNLELGSAKQDSSSEGKPEKMSQDIVTDPTPPAPAPINNNMLNKDKTDHNTDTNPPALAPINNNNMLNKDKPEKTDQNTDTNSIPQAQAPVPIKLEITPKDEGHEQHKEVIADESTNKTDKLDKIKEKNESLSNSTDKSAPSLYRQRSAWKWTEDGMGKLENEMQKQMKVLQNETLEHNETAS